MLYIAILLSLNVFPRKIYPSRIQNEMKRNNDFIQEKSNFGSKNFILRILPVQSIFPLVPKMNVIYRVDRVGQIKFDGQSDVFNAETNLERWNICISATKINTFLRELIYFRFRKGTMYEIFYTYTFQCSLSKL